MVTQGAEEELREEQEDCQELRQELAEAQTTLLEWDEWYDTEYLPLLEQQEDEHSLAETNALFRGFNTGNAEEEATQGAMAAKPLPQSSPLTPAVQQSSLNSSHLPPSSLPFQRKAPRASLATRGQEQEDAAAQQHSWKGKANTEIQYRPHIVDMDTGYRHSCCGPWRATPCAKPGVVESAPWKSSKSGVERDRERDRERER